MFAACQAQNLFKTSVPVEIKPMLQMVLDFYLLSKDRNF